MTGLRPTGADRLRGAGAALVLLTLTVGLPLALLALGGSPWPAHWPGWAGIAHALTRRDDGSLFLDALRVLAWAGWAVFAASLVIEAVAVARGRAVQGLPGLTGPRQLAAALITTSLLAVTGMRGHTGPPAPLPQLSAVVAASSASPLERGPAWREAALVGPEAAREGPTRGQPAAATPTAQASYLVRPGDTLWGIAATTLGDPESWPRIAALNYGRAQPDGRTLTDPRWIYAGWRLLLPTAEESVRANHSPTPPEPRQVWDDRQVASSASAPPATAVDPGHESPPPAGTTTGPAIVDHPPAQARPAGIRLGPGDLIDVTLATGLAAALLLSRLQRRRRYRPSPLTRPAQPADEPEALRRLQVAIAERLPDDPATPTTLAPGAVPLCRNDLAGQPADPASLAPSYDTIGVLTAGWDGDRLVGVDLLATGPLALTGAGSAGAIRAIALGFLAGAPANTTEVHVVGDLLPEVPHPAIRRYPDAATALSALEAALLARGRLLAALGAADFAALRAGNPDEPAIAVLLLTGAAAHPGTRARLRTLLGIGARLGVTAVLVGADPDLPTLSVGADGLTGELAVPADAPVHPALHQLAGLRLPVLTADTAAQLLRVLAAAGATSVADETSEAARPHSPDGLGHEADEHPARLQPPGREGSTDTGERLRIRIFGRPAIELDSQELTGLRRDAVDLLALLTVNAAGLGYETILDALWPDVDMDRAGARLRTALASLRTTVRTATGEADRRVVERVGDRYRLDADLLAAADVTALEEAIRAAAQSDDPDLAAAQLAAAAGYLSGPPLAGIAEIWAEPIRESLRRRSLDALSRLAQLHEQAGRTEEAIAVLEQAVAFDPYAEEMYRRLIRAHARAGRPDAARRAYRQLRHRLADLGVDPDRVTEQLLADVLARQGGDTSLAPDATPVSRAAR